MTLATSQNIAFFTLLLLLVIAGLLAVAVAFLNQKIREALNSYNQVQTDIGDIQEELKAIQVICYITK